MASLGKAACLAAGALLIGGCTGSSAPSYASCSTPGGAAAGDADNHCGTRAQATSAGACMPEAGTVPDAGFFDGGPPSVYGPTRAGEIADDDDCKYHVTWTSTPVCEGSGGVLFTVTATRKTDGSALAGADPFAEVFLGLTHPAPSSGSMREGPPGTYQVGPVVFDAPGRWTVRFHFDHQCDDTLPESPHGHVAFYVDVP
jgi:hypothetical protein